jgi:hypothetical protein
MPVPSSAERGLGPRNSSWSTYRLYGTTLTSDFAFANRLTPGTGPPDLAFTCVSAAPLPGGWEQTDPVYCSPPYPDEGGESEVLLYSLGDCLILRFTGICDFYLWPDQIICHPRTSEYRRRLAQYSYEVVERYQHMLIEVYLLGLVLSCWLEWRGTPALHASAVVVSGRAVAFLSNGGGGKSSSAATLMQAGYPLLADDIVPVRYAGEAYMACSGYPQMRMWPEQAQHFLGHFEDLGVVHPTVSKRRVPVEKNGLGPFCTTPQPLACLYLPERRNPADWGEGVEIKPVSRREAVMALVGYSFVPYIVEAMGLHVHRLGFFAHMSLEIPMRRVVYPSGFAYLPYVRRAILDDLAGLSSSLEVGC